MKSLEIQKFDVWLANLDPRHGTETGKTRPVLVVQSDLLNEIHPSTLICPITTNVAAKSQLLRVHLKKGMANVREDCDVMIDQIRAIDNSRLIKKIGQLPTSLSDKVQRNLSVVLDI